MDNNYKISHDTERVEELWTELSQAWPAVKNNPEIAEKIEKLWSILKDSGNDHLSISKEIESLLYSDKPTPVSKDTSSFTTQDTSANTYTKPDEIMAASKIEATQVDDDLDSLLAEILGENYQAETNSQPVIQTDKEPGITESKSSSSGTEELDKLVADILGEDWLKEDSNTKSPSTHSYDSKTTEIISPSDNSQPIFKSDNDIDSLVSSIIGDESNEETITPFTPTEQPEALQDTDDDDEEDIDILLNKIISEENLSDEISNNEIKPVENIDELISDILNNESVLPDVTSDLMSNDAKEEIITNENPEEDIDKLINEILSSDDKSSTAENNFSNVSDNEDISTDDNIEDILKNDTIETYVPSNLDNYESSEENIDDIINDVLKDETEEVYIAPNIENSEKEEENIDDLINEILKDKTDKKIIENDDTNIEEIQVQENKGTLAYQPGGQIINDAIEINKPKKVEPSTYKQPEQQSNNTLIIIIFIILILIFIGAWKLFFKKEEITQVTTIEKQQIENIYNTEEDSAVIEEPPVDEYTPATINKYQYEAETDYNLPAMEQSTIQPDYSTQIEEDNNDITITLNTPETAIESNTDSNIFNENETITTIEIEPLASDNINNIETITEKITPTETLGNDELVAEKVKKEKPVKIIAKRRVIIHKIVKGDTLWAIAKRYVNNPYRYPELAKLSKIKNPNRIYVGNKVRIIIYTK